MLPREFTRVEYIESTGSQYVDTGYLPTIDAQMGITFQIMSGGPDNGIIGNVDPNCCIVYNYSVVYGAFKQGTGQSASVNITSSYYDKHTASIRNGEFVLDNSAVQFAKINTYSSARSVYICALQYAGVYGISALRVWGARIAESGAYKRDYIPFINESGDANLWDDINHAAANKTGTFLAGSAIIPDAPANLAQTTTDGTVALTWDAADEYANHYKILRDGTELADVDGDIFAYIDTTVEAGGAHTYKVIACNGTQDGGAASVTVQLPLLIPQILAALITPNPTEINSKITITVTVSEIEKFLEPTYYYSGEIYAGEV